MMLNSPPKDQQIERQFQQVQFCTQVRSSNTLNKRSKHLSKAIDKHSDRQALQHWCAVSGKFITQPPLQALMRKGSDHQYHGEQYQRDVLCSASKESHHLASVL